MAQVPSCSEKSDTKNSAEETPPHKLRIRGGWQIPLVLYKNYWIHPNRIQNIISIEENFKPRHDNIILSTYPKCRTTWLKALAFTVMSRSHHGFVDHPLLTQHPQQLVPSIEIPAPGSDFDDMEKLPSPRLIATHLPLSLLPSTMTSCGRRVVYLSRQPKDAFISWWHFSNNMLEGSTPIELDDVLSMFCEGFSPYGPFWEHYLEHWKESLDRPKQVLFLKYEELMSDPVKVVRIVASFLAITFTEEEESRGVPEAVVKLCNFEMLSGLEHNHTGHLARKNNIAIGKGAFFRKGKAGDWENHMSRQMGRKVDDVVEDRFKGSGLAF